MQEFEQMRITEIANIFSSSYVFHRLLIDEDFQ